ncbi:MAG TPA: folylpolyglutamate synthase/dihydrofolate synthase family protein [Candidatus Cloacimonadota bacterium]|nr:folylpolyglutamate synthase/dihydrofolate synthase family protein [Candidatus Cloacimonadota bacterium]
MDYQSFLTHIYERYSGNVKLGLDRMYGILEKMGNPEKKIKGIHIAGTNGKGSVSAMSEALSIGQGYSTGMNTSPHLIDYCERFRFNGKNIDYTEIMNIHSQYQTIFDEFEASFFEITTAIAFELMYQKQVDTSIIEVGLGGRLDGTNPFNSTVCVITTISLDHPKSLGSSIEEIAYEKAGIIKEFTPVVLGNIVDEAKKVIQKVAQEKKAPVYLFNKDYLISNVCVSEEGTTFNYEMPDKKIKLDQIKINMLGEHQAINAASALTAFILYNEAIQRVIDFTKVRESLQKINWFGRMQVLHTNPLVIIDGAHNEEGITTLISNLKKMFPNKYIRFVVAILRDKKLDNMIADICRFGQEIYISKNKSERAADLEEQIEVAKQFDIPYFGFDDVLSATSEAWKKTQAHEILVITGSLYTIAEILKIKEDLFK